MTKRHYRKAQTLPNLPTPIAFVFGLLLLLMFGCLCLLSSLNPNNNSPAWYLFLIGVGVIFGIVIIVVMIFVIAKYKEQQRKALQNAAATISPEYKQISNLSSIGPRELEELAAKVYEKLGYKNVKHTGAHSSTDGGVDVWMLNPEGHVEIVQCKQLSNRVDRTEVVLFAKTMRQQHAVIGHYWAPNEFTQPAIDYAKEHNIQLYEKEEILGLIMRAFPQANSQSPNSQNSISPDSH